MVNGIKNAPEKTIYYKIKIVQDMFSKMTMDIRNTPGMKKDKIVISVVYEKKEKKKKHS